MQLNVRADWLLEAVEQYPEWALLVCKLIQMNAFMVMPAQYGWFIIGGVRENDLVVLEEGVKGSPCAYRVKGKKVVCTNYDLKPMTFDEFIEYVKEVQQKGYSRYNLERIASILKQK